MHIKNILKIAVPVLIITWTLTGCGKTPEDKGVVLASIGDSTITLSDFNDRIANLPDRYRDVVKKRKDEFLQELVNDTLLYQEALRKNLHKDGEVQEMIEEAKRKIIVTRLLKDEVDDRIEITDEEVREFYDKNSERYKTPEIMRVSHILLLSREDAEGVVEELSQGASFEDLARAKSVDPTAQRAGDIGYFPKGQLMPDFEEACAGLEVGEVSGIVKTKLGYHVIKLTDRKEPEQVPIEKVDEDIRSRISAIKRQEAFNGLLDRLRDGTAIEVNEELLVVQEEQAPQVDADGGQPEDETEK